MRPQRSDEQDAESGRVVGGGRHGRTRRCSRRRGREVFACVACVSAPAAAELCRSAEEGAPDGSGVAPACIILVASFFLFKFSVLMMFRIF